MEPFVQKQYDEYQANYVEKDVLSKEELRDMIINDLSKVSQMGVGEYTLYQKWLEIQMKYPCLLYTSPSPRDATLSRMPSSA